MKLTGRLVVFNYLMELNATDVEIALAIARLLKSRTELVDAVTAYTSLDNVRVLRFVDTLSEQTAIAKEQIGLTRDMFDGGPGRMVGKSSMRGIQIPAVREISDATTPES